MLDEIINDEVNNEHVTLKTKEKASSPLQKFFNQRCANFVDSICYFSSIIFSVKGLMFI